MHILHIRVRHKPGLISARAQEYAVRYLVLLKLGGQESEEPQWIKMPQHLAVKLSQADV